MENQLNFLAGDLLHEAKECEITDAVTCGQSLISFPNDWSVLLTKFVSVYKFRSKQLDLLT